MRAQVPAFVPFAEAQKIPSVKKIFHDASESEAKSMYAGIIKLRLSRCWGMATDICVRLGRKIRELRRSRGWRQIDLAEHSGISKNHISELERGQREVGLKNLEAVAEALDLRPSELLRVSGL